MSKQPAAELQEAQAGGHHNRVALVCWTMVALVYFLLAAYLAWFSVDKDLPQAAVWFALGVCFFCIGLIPVPRLEPKAVDTNPEHEMPANKKS